MKFDTTAVLSGLHFLESPRWHNGRVWVSDIYGRRVYSAAEDGRDLRVEAEFDGLPSGLGWLADDTLLIAMTGHDHRLLRRSPTGELSAHADLGNAHGPLCDMVTDFGGSAYIGAFGFDAAAGAPIAEGVIYRVSPHGAVEVAADGLLIPNGMAITDNRRLIVNESFGNRITTFAITPDGFLHDRAELVRFGPPPTSRSIAEVIPALTVACRKDPRLAERLPPSRPLLRAPGHCHRRLLRSGRHHHHRAQPDPPGLDDPPLGRTPEPPPLSTRCASHARASSLRPAWGDTGGPSSAP